MFVCLFVFFCFFVCDAVSTVGYGQKSFVLIFRDGLFVFVEIDLLGLILFSFAISNFCCWINFLGFVYFVSGFKSSVMAFKRRKMLELQTSFFTNLSDYW